MSKSKAKNIKRSKMMRQRKKEREALMKEKLSGKAVIEERLNNSHGLKNVNLRDKNNSSIKISNLIYQLVEPLMKMAKTFKEEKNTIGLGVLAWNLGTIKTLKGQEQMEKAFEEFSLQLSPEYKKLLLDYIEIKCRVFPDFDEIIFEYEYKPVNGKNNLTVAYKSVNEE
jgi:hypothetical protein